MVSPPKVSIPIQLSIKQQEEERDPQYVHSTATGRIALKQAHCVAQSLHLRQLYESLNLDYIMNQS